MESSWVAGRRSIRGWSQRWCCTATHIGDPSMCALRRAAGVLISLMRPLLLLLLRHAVPSVNWKLLSPEHYKSSRSYAAAVFAARSRAHCCSRRLTHKVALIIALNASARWFIARAENFYTFVCSALCLLFRWQADLRRVVKGFATFGAQTDRLLNETRNVLLNFQRCRLENSLELINIKSLLMPKYEQISIVSVAQLLFFLADAETE